MRPSDEKSHVWQRQGHFRTSKGLFYQTEPFPTEQSRKGDQHPDIGPNVQICICLFLLEFIPGDTHPDQNQLRPGSGVYLESVEMQDGRARDHK